MLYFPEPSQSLLETRFRAINPLISYSYSKYVKGPVCKII